MLDCSNQGCPELLFLHSVSGCDYTSSFFKVEKIKFWDLWLESENVSSVFHHMSLCPVLPIPEEYLQAIERFVISVYDRSLKVDLIDSVRFEIFKFKGDFDIRSIPPTSNALRLHIHRAAYISGWIWGLSHIPESTLESPYQWGWSKDGEIGSVKVIWTNYNPELAISTFKKSFNKCGCRTNCSKKCSCRKLQLCCLTICKCRGKCMTAITEIS